VIAARAVTKAFGRRTVLRDVDLTLDGPVLIRVEGANGAGKSTLLRLLAGISRPTRGRVETITPRAFVPERFQATGALRAGELLKLTRAEPCSASTTFSRARWPRCRRVRRSGSRSPPRWEEPRSW
jgi:ABC-type multidrug transport system ATPase subunit